MAEQPLPEGTDTIIAGAGVIDEDEADGETSFSPVDEDLFTPDAEDDDEPVANSGADAKGTEAKDAKPAQAAAGFDLGEGGFFDRIESFKSQGYDRARDYAVQGKDRATGALDDLLQTINDAAEQIDSKVGSQYGDYARRAAESLGGFNDALKGKDVDELFTDARALIARAPAVAVGTAAVLGFVVARLAKAGIDTASDAVDSDKTRRKA